MSSKCRQNVVKLVQIFKIFTKMSSNVVKKNSKKWCNFIKLHYSWRFLTTFSILKTLVFSIFSMHCFIVYHIGIAICCWKHSSIKSKWYYYMLFGSWCTWFVIYILEKSRNDAYRVRVPRVVRQYEGFITYNRIVSSYCSLVIKIRVTQFSKIFENTIFSQQWITQKLGPYWQSKGLAASVCTIMNILLIPLT